MHAIARCSRFFRHTLLASCLLMIGAASAFAQLPDPVCEYTGPELVGVDEPFMLCGPEAEGYFWSWHDLQGNLLTTDRCLNFPQGLPEPGCYDYELTVSQGEDFIKCIVTVCVDEKDPPDCEIRIEEECDSAELCGPDGYNYLWEGPGVTGETTQCVTVTEDGSYSLTITDKETDLKSECKVEIELSKDCAENCPRTPGYWQQQAEQRDNGATKFSRAQVIAIAECISARVDVFDWGTGETALANFHATVWPGGGPMTCERQLKRHLAALLANICATGVEPTHGGEVFLDGSTTVDCNGDPISIDDLIDEVDDLLTGPGSNHCDYIDCLDAINNGIGIPLASTCEKEASSERVQKASRLSGTPTELSFAATNPASRVSVLSFSLPADADVSVKIFDVAGREIADLGGGYTTAGSHTIHWNVAGVARGLYFARLVAGGQTLTRQIAVTN